MVRSHQARTSLQGSKATGSLSVTWEQVMFDMRQVGLPTLVESGGVRWIAVYYVGPSQDRKASLYLACKTEDELPTPIHLIAVPKLKVVPEDT